VERSTVGRLVVVACLAGGLVVVPGASPAGAAVVATSAGSAVTVTVTGEETIRMGCDGTIFKVNFAAVTPSVSCAAVSHVTVNGDAANQRVYGNDLNDPNLTANPYLTATLNDGHDFVYETDRADSIVLGNGNDGVALVAGGIANPSVNLGSEAADNDQMYAYGTSGNDTMTVTSGSPNVTVTATGAPMTALDVETLTVDGFAGNDTIDATGVNGASALAYQSLQGNLGNDTITGGVKAVNFFGGDGTNAMTGGAAADTFWTTSDTDTIATGGGNDMVYDTDSLRFGGRTYSSTNVGDRYSAEQRGNDTVVRVRPTATPGNDLITASLNRTGQQVLPPAFVQAGINFNYFGETRDVGLADVVATGRAIYVNGDTFDDDLVDFTIPAGSWTTSGTLGEGYSILPANPAYKELLTDNVGAVNVHNPWTDLRQGFAHRMIRDLLFRFPSALERDSIRDQLAAGTFTRAQVISFRINSDEYRGLDVDRVYVDFLNRPADPSGRNYWISALRTGRSLRKFRAQIFGSNQYFTMKGATNASYVVAAYADVLGRAPDPSGAAYWTNKINTGTERGVVAEQFLATTEARRSIVTDQFLRFLDRKPTTAESDYWVGILGTAQGEQELIASLTGSAAYYNRD
jgi:hypothetical protein